MINMFIDTIKTQMVKTPSDCHRLCTSTLPDCTGFVTKKLAKNEEICYIKTGILTILGEKMDTKSVILPCP